MVLEERKEGCPTQYAWGQRFIWTEPGIKAESWAFLCNGKVPGLSTY